MIRKVVGFTTTVVKHKSWVFFLMCKAGRPIQGLMHDNSKFSPVEYFTSIKYWHKGESPVTYERKAKGYSEIYLHHKGRNRHHYVYWLDLIGREDRDPIPLIMPEKYAVEMICDWLAAGIVYQGKDWNWSTPLARFYNVENKERIHSAIKAYAEEVLIHIAIDQNFNIINKEDLRRIYEKHCKAKEE